MKTWLKTMFLVFVIALGIGILICLEGLMKIEKDQAFAMRVFGNQEASNSGYERGDDVPLSSSLVFDQNGVVCYEDRIFLHFRNEENQIEHTASMAEGFLKESGISNLCLVPLPERNVVEDEKDFEAYTNYAAALNQALDDRVKYIDVLPELAAHRDEYIFFGTENSWTARGAYYGSAAISKALGIEPRKLSEYREYHYNDFFGSLLVDYPELSFPDTVSEDSLYYYLLPNDHNRARVEQTDKVWEVQPVVSESRMGMAAFLDGVFFSAVLEGVEPVGEKKDETLLLLADTQGKLLASYLSGYYKTVYVINIEWNRDFYEELPKLLKKYEIGDVVWAQNITKLGNLSYSRAMKPFFKQ